jgi:hypothetical protein
MVCAVIQAPSSDGRDPITLPMSSGSPRRPNAVSAAIGGITSGIPGERVVGEARPGRAGGDRVHPNPLGC